MHDDVAPGASPSARRGRGARSRGSVVGAAVLGALVVLVVLVALVGLGVVGLPGSDDDDGGGRDSDGAGTGCRAGTDVDLADVDADVAGGARWVRFCPLAEEGLGQRVRHPQGLVTGDLAASVATGLWQTQLDRPSCGPGEAPRPTGLFRVEVGLADGRVAALEGDTGCSERDRALYSQLETTLLMEAAAAAGPEVAPAPVRCPRRLALGSTTSDGSSADQLLPAPGQDQPWQSTVPVLPMPASAATVCAYRGRGGSLTPVGRWEVGAAGAERLRAATRLVRIGARAACEPDPRRTSYVVVLADRTGTARALAVDGAGCGTVRAAIGTPPVPTALGLARPGLLRALARSRP